jgi:hypothetical protein
MVWPPVELPQQPFPVHREGTTQEFDTMARIKLASPEEQE